MSIVAEKGPINHINARREATKVRQKALNSAILTEAQTAASQRPLSRKKIAMIRLLQERWPDYQPVMEMAEKAMRISQIADQRPSDSLAQMDAVNAHEKVAKYVTPQLKAMDLTSGGEQIQFGFQLNLANITKA